MKVKSVMRYLSPCIFLAGCALQAASVTPVLSPSNSTIGQNLQAPAVVELSEPAPSQGLTVTLTSSDPKKLLLSTAADAEGSASITVSVFGGYRSTPQFFLFALGKSGVATYTASAPGFTSAQGKVALTPSGILVAGWLNFGSPLVVTTGQMPLPVKIYAAQLDKTGNLGIVQPIRGGMSVKAELTNSSPEIGTLESGSLTIQGGSSTAKAQFKPAKAGETTFSVNVPAGFTAPAQFTSATVKVNLPGIGITDQIMIGENLQTNGVLTLGEFAPQAGVAVTITSDDPSMLLISANGSEVGSKSATITVPGGDNRAPYFLQGLKNHGKVTYTASAPGFRNRTATITLAPSGLIITGPTGPPDEAEYLRPYDPVGPNGLFASMKTKEPVGVVVYTAFLDPKTHRAADITIQQLRAGLTVNVDVKNENPGMGSADQHLTIPGGTDRAVTFFKPLAIGSTILSISTPNGFTQPSNAQGLTAVVRN